MKRLLILAFALAGFNAASATPICGNGSLASYVALGSGGCTIGGDLVTSFTLLSLSSGATAISASSVMVMPSGGMFNPELTFTFTQTANANQTFESFFTYKISGPPYISDVINIAGSSESGNGDVTDTQTYCAGGTFGPDGVDNCTGSSTNSLIAIDGAVQSASTALSRPTSIAVTDDFVIDSGGQGSASAGMFSDQFTATPEPAVFLLTGSGLMFALLRKRKSPQVISKH